MYDAVVAATTVDTVQWSPETLDELEHVVEEGLAHSFRSVRISSGYAEFGCQGKYRLTIICRTLLATALARGARSPELKLHHDRFCGPMIRILKKRGAETQEALRETTLVTLGLVGKIADDASFCNALFAIVNELGHPNILLRGLAHLQVRARHG